MTTKTKVKQNQAPRLRYVDGNNPISIAADGVNHDGSSWQSRVIKYSEHGCPFIMSGNNGEDFLTVHHTGMQSGRIAILVVYAPVDSPIYTASGDVRVQNRNQAWPSDNAIEKKINELIRLVVRP